MATATPAETPEDEVRAAFETLRASQREHGAILIDRRRSMLHAIAAELQSPPATASS